MFDSLWLVLMADAVQQKGRIAVCKALFLSRRLSDPSQSRQAQFRLLYGGFAHTLGVFASVPGTERCQSST